MHESFTVYQNREHMAYQSQIERRTKIMDEQNVGFEEFMGAFDEGADYQNDTPEEVTMEPETPTDGDQQPADDAPGEEYPGAVDAGTNGDDGKGAENPAKDAPEIFTLKVNKEERTYSREEVISLAQKGADYDRVKDQLGKSQQAASELQGKLDGQQETMEILQLAAKELGTDIPGLLDSLRISAYRKQGLSEDAANERLLRVKAEQENAKLKSGKPAAAEPIDESKQRAQRDLEEFRKAYPDVALTEDLLDELLPGIQDGVSMLQSYRKREIAQKDAVIAEKEKKIAQLERQIEAEKQNKANRAGSPGSQKDSGGKRTKSEYDEFMEAFG